MLNKMIKINNKQFIIFIILLIVLLVILVPFIRAILENNCCKKLCITKENSCSGKDYLCKYSDSCKIGCCKDTQGFEHNNYPNGKCIGSGGKFYQGVCKGMNVCKE